MYSNNAGQLSGSTYAHGGQRRSGNVTLCDIGLPIAANKPPQYTHTHASAVSHEYGAITTRMNR